MFTNQREANEMWRFRWFKDIFYENKTNIMLIGREKEKQILQDALTEEYSQFIAVYGRRRVGKTFLIREA